MGKNLPTHSANAVYDHMAGFYDTLAHGIVFRRQKRAIELMNIEPGAKVLEIGIGTGSSMTLYPAHCTVYGIDLSGGMLAKAHERMEAGGHANFRLVRCDALHPPFADGAFDYIFASHVISVVADPVRLVKVIKRLGKPGCRIVLINHFKSPNRLMGILEHWLNPLCHKLGWRSDLTLQELVDGGGLQVDFQYKHQWCDLWRTVFATNAPPDTRTIRIARDGETFSSASRAVPVPPAPSPAVPAPAPATAGVERLSPVGAVPA